MSCQLYPILGTALAHTQYLNTTYVAVKAVSNVTVQYNKVTRTSQISITRWTEIKALPQ